MRALTSAGWSSLAARRAHNPKVAGSNPAPATNQAKRPREDGAFCFKGFKLVVEDALESVVGPTITGLGYELLGIDRQRLPRGLLLRLYIDGPDGITLADCEKVSKQVRDLLEAEQALRDDYLLEISSPGLDRPLFKVEHYQRQRGALVLLRLRIPQDGRRRLQGILVEVDERAVVLELADARLSIPFNAIERARVVPVWPEKNPPKRNAQRRKKRTG